MSKKKIRFGILGCADIARRKFIPALKKCKDAELGAIASRSSKKACEVAGKYGVEFCSYDELIEASNIDAIYIPLPNIYHYEWTLKALSCGKHVLCEKPIALDYVSAKKIIKKARAKKKALMEGYMFLFHPQHKIIKKIINDGAIGKIRIFCSSFGFALKDRNNFRLKKGMGGDALYELGGYPIRAMRYFIGQPLEEISGFSFYDSRKIQISYRALLAFSGGVSAYINGGYDQAYECYYQIVGDKASLTLERCYTTPSDMKNVISIRKDNDIKQIQVGACDHFLEMINHFCEAVNLPQKRERLYNEIDKQAKMVDTISLHLKKMRLSK